MNKNNSNSRLIYSTDAGRICPDCSKPKNSCICRQLKRSAPGTSSDVRIIYETAGRKGKGMTLISGLPLNEKELFDLARDLKHKFGIGGAVKGPVIELQGDQREKVSDVLRKSGLLK